MKTVLFFAFLSAFTCCTPPASKAPVSLDGRTFKIESFTGGKSEGTERMIFKDGKVENDVCTQWGFGNAPYTCDADGNFNYTLSSAAEGRMDWEGRVSGKSVEGKMAWVKAGQADIHYTFKGAEE